MNRPGEAIVHYQRAAELQIQMPIEALLSMGEMATCKILTREFTLLVHIWLCNWCIFYVHILFDLIFCSFTLDPVHVLQVTMMVLCQCSQRCSWFAKRGDCSCRAPAPLLVRFSTYLQTLLYKIILCMHSMLWLFWMIQLETEMQYLLST